MKLKIDSEVIAENLLNLFKSFGALNKNAVEVSKLLQEMPAEYQVIIKDFLFHLVLDLTSQITVSPKELTKEEQLVATRVIQSSMPTASKPRSEEAIKIIEKYFMDYYLVAFREGQLSVSRALEQVKKETKK